MKIVFLSHYFPPEGNAPATRVFEMCRRWVRTGHEVTVITGVPNVPNGVVYEGYRNRLRQEETIHGIRVVRVWTHLAPNKGTVRRILNYLSFMISATLAGLFAPRPDVVIATSPQFFCGWAGVLVSRLRRLPFILEIRDIWPESIVTVGALRGRGLVALLEWLEKRMYAAARHIVTVGDGYRERLQEKGVPPERISVVTNGVDPATFFPREPDAALRERYGLAGRFVCSYVGTIGMACGLDVVLRAAQRLKEKGRDSIRFLLVGDGAVRAELEQQARTAGLDEVVFAGLQPKPAIPAFLAVSDACLVHLHKRELFKTVLPSKILEAAAMEKPIILGVRGHAERLVREAGAGICIEPDNADELVAAVERLASDPELGKKMGRAGRDHVRQHFNPDVLAAEYLALIAAAAAPRPPRT